MDKRPSSQLMPREPTNVMLQAVEKQLDGMPEEERKAWVNSWAKMVWSTMWEAHFMTTHSVSTSFYNAVNTD